MVDKRTYKDVGIDLDGAEEIKSRIKEIVRKTHTSPVLADIGLFGGLFEFNKEDFKNPVLVSSTDGVGTKLKIAFTSGTHHTVGQCLVNHCVNDILAQGAIPLFFLDYIAAGETSSEIISSIIEGIARACEINRCALIGGETAQMPEFYNPNEYDLAGFIVGVVEKDRIIDGSKIGEGDLILGLPSSGLHTNGYTLARKIIFEDLSFGIDDFVPDFGRTVEEELLSIHLSYLRPISKLLDSNLISGIAHITGGGLEGNISRIIPPGLSAQIDLASWEPLPIFKLLQEKGKVIREEMYRVFNMGIGIVVLVPEGEIYEAMNVLKSLGQDFYRIGKVKKGKDRVILEGI